MTLKEILGDEYKEGMTPEEIEAAVAKSKKVVSKHDFDKKTSELVNTKKQLEERLTEQEKQALEKEASDKALREELDALIKEKTVAQHTTGLVGIGYSEEQANKIATAFSEGDFDTVISEMKSHNKTLKKSIEKELLENTPRPNPSEGEDEPPKKKISEMSIAEMQKMYTKDPEGFKQIKQGENKNG